MKNKTILLVLLLLIHVTAWFLMKPVWPFSDDYCYCFHAHNLLNGGFNLTSNQLQNRFGVYVPVSFFYYCFDIGPYTMALWPLIASCLTIAIVFSYLGKVSNIRVAFISSFLIALNTLQITYSIAVFPDLIVSFYAIAVILVLYYGRHYKNKTLVYPALLNMFLLLGFFTKETILLTLPFLVIVLVHDLYKRQHTLFWKRVLIMCICAVLLQFLIYYFITGDAFFRIKAFLKYTGRDWLLSEQSEANIRAMYSSNIFEWINGELGYVFLMIVAVYSFFLLHKKEVSDFHFFIMVYSMVLLSEFIFLFFTKSYGPLFMMDRVWMPLIAPLSITSAYLIYRAEDKFYLTLLIFLTGLCMYNYYAVSFMRAVLFASFLIAVVISYYFKYKNKPWNVLLLVPFMILSAYFIYNNTNYRAGSLSSGDLIKGQLEKLNDSEKKIILCDEAFAENHIVYNKFREYSYLSFFPFNKSDSVAGLQNVYAIVNAEETKTPDFIIQKDWKKVFDQDKLLIFKKEEN